MGGALRPSRPDVPIVNRDHHRHRRHRDAVAPQTHLALVSGARAALRAAEVVNVPVSR
jgi:hypothetical protein